MTAVFLVMLGTSTLTSLYQQCVKIPLSYETQLKIEEAGAEQGSHLFPDKELLSSELELPI